jgi:hypothetical protein
MYLFTNSALPESKWQESDPKVYVESVNDGEDRNAMKWLHEQDRIYYIGGYQGCGCGWGAVSEWDKPEDRAAKTKDRAALVDLLRQIDLQSSWFIVCWEGDQGEPMHPPKVISLEDIENPEFEFIELQQYEVAQQGGAPDALTGAGGL